LSDTVGAVIALLTDFSSADSYVAEMKGVLLTALPAVTLVDITHSIPPGDVRSGAHVLRRVWRRFPEGTVFLAVVDPGVGTERAALAISSGGRWFVGPDNGLFTPVLDAADEILELPTPPGASPTFHGRDLFAPVAAALAGRTAPRSLGTAFTGAPVRFEQTEPHYEGKSVVGTVVYVDRFGSLVTNLTPELVPPYARIEIEDVDAGPLRRTFGDVPTGGLVCYIGSSGDVEIAVRDGSAARRLGMGVGGRVRARLG
jgi:hypothetical protein